jgi:hypothetical protein
MALKDGKRCNAHSKRTGAPCGAVAMKGRDKCKNHGGHSLKGIASPTFKDGKRSKYMHLPEHLSARVGEYINDHKLIELRENIAVTDTRITELYERLRHDASRELNDAVWDKITNLFEQRRRLVESESKRLKDSQQTITSEQFLIFIQFILSVIKENVTDRQQLNKISEKFILAGTSNHL